MITVRRLTLVVLVLAGLSDLALAQRKPPPAAYTPPPPKEIDYAGFAAAYDRAGEPRLAVTCHYVGGAADSRAGVLEAFRDGEGVCRQLESGIANFILKLPRVELVEVGLAEAAAIRQRTLALQRGQAVTEADPEVIDFPADVHLSVELSPASSSTRARYRVFVGLYDLSRGRSIGQFSFDWLLDSESRTTQQYAHEITRRVVEQFTLWYNRPAGEGRDYTLKLVGVRSMDDLMAARRAFETIPGMGRVRTRGFAQGAEAGAALMAVRYDGDAFELLYELQESARARLGMKVSGLDSNAGVITLELNPRLANRQRWLRFVEPGTPDFEQAKAALTQAYLANDQPRIAVLFVRELGLSNPADAGVIQEYRRQATEQRMPLSPAPLVTHKAKTATTDGVGPDALMDLRMLEDRIYQSLLPLGLRLVDPKRLAETPPTPLIETPLGVYSEEQLPQLIANLGGIDVLIYGVVRQGLTADGEAIDYSVRVIRLADDLTMAADSWSSRYLTEIPQSFGQDPHGAVGRLLAGKLLDQALAFWSNPNLMLVRVEKLRSQRDLMFVLNALRDNVDGVGSVRVLSCEPDGAGELQGLLEVRANTSPEQLAQAVGSLGSEVPLAVEEVRDATVDEGSMLGGSGGVIGSAPLRTLLLSLGKLGGFEGGDRRPMTN